MTAPATFPDAVRMRPATPAPVFPADQSAVGNAGGDHVDGSAGAHSGTEVKLFDYGRGGRGRLTTDASADARVAPAASNRAVQVSVQLGRYEVSATLGTTTHYRTDSLDVAMLQLEMFSRAHAANRDAQFGIYDFQTRKTIENWRGGKPHGPVDLMHPMERMIQRARAAGQKTFVGGIA